MAEPEADKNKNDSGGGEDPTENNKNSSDPESDSSSEGGGFIDYFPRGVEDTNTPEYNIKLFEEVLNNKEMQKKREKEEKEFQFHEDLFDFPKYPEKWTEQDLQELWADAPLDMKKPGWDPVWADADDWDVVLDELEEGRDPPIAPFYLPYRKHYPAIPDNHFDISTPESVIEELDRIEEFLRWVSYIFPDGSSSSTIVGFQHTIGGSSTRRDNITVVDIVEDENIEDRGLGLENLVDACYGVHEGVRGDVYGGTLDQISDFEQPFVPEPDLGKKYL
ncbi:hypothetical protein IFM89_017004 [Coptis chinensis]|uniref:Uncharacterized protein n=1 Tax=Coptis chinensis TaxID=261450 RepID=A0A835IX82_9MAGN|nr:hypothetical protein IFM89_017004 [Coptis chinensis]